MTGERPDAAGSGRKPSLLQRREYPRREIEIPATLTCFDDQMNVRQTDTGRTRNLGEEGALLSFDTPPIAQAMDWVEIALEVSPNRIRLFGRIVAVRGLRPGGRTEVHVQFTACERQDLARLRRAIRAEPGA